MPYYLRYAPTNRAHCSSCKESIPQGAIKLGVEVKFADHDSVSFRCLECITTRVANNIIRYCDGDLSMLHTDQLEGKGDLKLIDHQKVERIILSKAGVEIGALKTAISKKKTALDQLVKEAQLDSTAHTKQELATLCRLNGLKVSGLKAELYERLKANRINVETELRPSLPTPEFTSLYAPAKPKPKSSKPKLVHEHKEDEATYLECTIPPHNKWWQIVTHGNQTHVTWGKIGLPAEGASDKDWADEAAAQKFEASMIRTKLSDRKGYHTIKAVKSTEDRERRGLEINFEALSI